MTGAEAVKVIGKLGYFHSKEVPWKIHVFIADVRTVYGRTDYLIGEAGVLMATTQRVWVEASRVTVVEPEKF